MSSLKCSRATFPPLYYTKPNPSSLQVLIPSPELSFSPQKLPARTFRPLSQLCRMKITLSIFAPPAHLQYSGWRSSLLQAAGLPGGLSGEARATTNLPRVQLLGPAFSIMEGRKDRCWQSKNARTIALPSFTPWAAQGTMPTSLTRQGRAQETKPEEMWWDWDQPPKISGPLYSRYGRFLKMRYLDKTVEYLRDAGLGSLTISDIYSAISSERAWCFERKGDFWYLRPVLPVCWFAPTVGLHVNKTVALRLISNMWQGRI